MSTFLGIKKIKKVVKENKNSFNIYLKCFTFHNEIFKIKLLFDTYMLNLPWYYYNASKKTRLIVYKLRSHKQLKLHHLLWID